MSSFNNWLKWDCRFLIKVGWDFFYKKKKHWKHLAFLVPEQIVFSGFDSSRGARWVWYISEILRATNMIQIIKQNRCEWLQWDNANKNVEKLCAILLFGDSILFLAFVRHISLDVLARIVMLNSKYFWASL